MKSVGVAIVSYNTCALLRDCLASLRACTQPLQTVVLDNGSRDGSPAMVRAEFPEVILLEPERNLGFAAGNNYALNHLFGAPNVACDTPAALLLNPDTVVGAGAIEALVAFLVAHPRVGVVGPRLLNPDGSVQSAAFRFPTLSMTALDLFPPGQVLPGRLYNSWLHGRYPHEANASQPFSIDHPLGACMLVRREVITQTGGFDPAFFMYAEEIEWCLRIRQAGWAIWQEPAARVIHHGGASTSQFRTNMQIALWESRMRLFQKHYSAAVVRAHATLIRLGMLRLTLLAWRDFAQGLLDRSDLRARLWTFGQILRLL